MPDEPIIVRNDGGPSLGESQNSGVSLYLEDGAGDWSITGDGEDATVLTIRKPGRWQVSETTDPATGARMIRIFLEGGDLSSVRIDK